MDRRKGTRLAAGGGVPRGAAVLLALLFFCGAPASAGELGLLLDRLVEKQVLGPDEAREILAAGAQGNGSAGARPGLAGLRGDFRLRYQFNDNGNAPETRHRGRYRLRLSFAPRISGKVRVGFGFASGGSADPRSTNQTLTGNNSKKALYIDSAFAEYSASGSLALTAGRAKPALWLSSDLLWDGDINLEGAAVRLTGPRWGNWRFFAGAGLVVLDESAAVPGDPYLLYAQPGISWRGPDGRFDIKAGAAFYGFSHVKGAAALPHRPPVPDYQRANTLVSSRYKYDYDAAAPEIEFNWNIPDPVPVPLLGSMGFDVSYAGLFGSAVKALSHSADASGWLAGLRLGQRKADAPGRWQLRCSYRRLEADAWPDNYPDSDFYGGATNVKGFEAGLTLGLANAMTLEFDYYRAGPLKGGPAKESLLQTDVNLKF